MQVPYFQRGARINLTSRKVEFERLDHGWYRKFFGGKGLGALLLVNRLAPLVDPLSPENIMIFLTGPLTGSAYPSSNRGVLVTKSPLTGGFLDSNIGGSLGRAIKSAGLDYVIFEGKSSSPVWVAISDAGIVFRDALYLWGKTTGETEAAIKKEMNQPGTAVASIGQAGELGVLFSSIGSDQRMFGRGGAGAVMGSKNLKAVAFAGRAESSWFDAETFAAETKKARQKLSSNPSTKKDGPFPLYGTTFTTDVTNTMGVLPTRNWQESTYEGATSLYAAAFSAKKVKSTTCYQCPIACGRLLETESGRLRGPEYETIYAFGSNCGISDIDTVIRANHLCEEYGLDTITCGVVISFLMECAEKGIVKEYGSYPLPRFGDREGLIAAIEYIGKGGTPGDPVRKGVKRLAAEIGQGTEHFAIAVKGLELPGYDPRGMKGMALLYATSDRGGCHVRGSTLKSELLGLAGPVDRFGYQGKAQIAASLHPVYAMMNSYSGCLFSAFALTIDD